MQKIVTLICLILLSSTTGCNSFVQTGKPGSWLSSSKSDLRKKLAKETPASGSLPSRVDDWTDDLDQVIKSPRQPVGDLNVEKIEMEGEENLHVFEQTNLADIDEKQLPEFLEASLDTSQPNIESLNVADSNESSNDPDTVQSELQTVQAVPPVTAAPIQTGQPNINETQTINSPNNSLHENVPVLVNSQESEVAETRVAANSTVDNKTELIPNHTEDVNRSANQLLENSTTFKNQSTKIAVQTNLDSQRNGNQHQSGVILIQATPPSDESPDYSQSPSMYLLEEPESHQDATREHQAAPIETSEPCADCEPVSFSVDSTRRTTSQIESSDSPLNENSQNTESIFFHPIPNQDRDEPTGMLVGWDSETAAELAKNRLLPPDFSTVTGGSKSWKELLNETIEALELQHDQLAQSRANQKGRVAEQIRSAIQTRLLRLAAGDIESALLPIEGLSSTEQAFWHHQFVLVNNFLHSTNSRIGNSTMNPAIAQESLHSLRQAQLQLAQLAPLEIVKTELCRSVDGYGKFELIDSGIASNQKAIVYCELRNFLALPIEQGGSRHFSSRLRGSYQIINERNQIVGQQQYEITEDLSRNVRTDFYMYFPVAFPELPAGNYRLNISIEDVNANKRAEKLYPKTISIAGESAVKTANQPSSSRR